MCMCVSVLYESVQKSLFQIPRLAQKDLKWTINICTHFFHQRGKQPRFLVFQKILRTSYDFAQNHVGGALFDVSKVGVSTLKIHF